MNPNQEQQPRGGELKFISSDNVLLKCETTKMSIREIFVLHGEPKVTYYLKVIYS